MLDVIETMSPILILLVLGYSSVKFNYLKNSDVQGVINFAFKIAIPSLVFISINHLDFASFFNLKFLLSYYLAALFCYFIAMVIFFFYKRKEPNFSLTELPIYGGNACLTNLLFIGVPVMNIIFTDDLSWSIIFLIISTQLPIMMTLTVLLVVFLSQFDSKANTKYSLKTLLLRICKDFTQHPLIIALLVSFTYKILANIFDFGIPLIAEQVLSGLAKAAGFVVIFAIGGSLVKYKIKGDLIATLPLILLKLMIMPLIALISAVYIFQMDTLTTKILVLIAAMPLGTNAYLIAEYYKKCQTISLSNFVLNTFLAIISLSFWFLITEKFIIS